MDISIIIVTWNSKGYIKSCLDSIFRYTENVSYEIIVIDNASSDGTKEVLQHYRLQNTPSPNLSLSRERDLISSPPSNGERKREGVIVYFNTLNLGFARANNQGIRQACGRYIILLNPDTELKDNTLEKMIEFMDKHQEVGIVGPKLLNSDGSIQYSVRRFPKLLDQMLILLKLHNVFPNGAAIRKYFMLGFEYEKNQEVDQIMGATFMVRRAVLDKIGFLDEGFRRNFEEVDYCYRAKQAGVTIYYNPLASITHHKGASFKSMHLIEKQRHWNHDVLCYFRKHKPLWQWTVLRVVQWVGLIITDVVMVIGWIFNIERMKKKEL